MNTGAEPYDVPFFHLPLYRRGAQVHWRGDLMTVHHVLVRKGGLEVYFDEYPNPVKPESIDMPLTGLTWPAKRPMPPGLLEKAIAVLGPSRQQEQQLLQQQAQQEKKEEPEELLGF